MYLAVLSFLMLLAAAVLRWIRCPSHFFSVFLVAIATFVSMEMRRSEQEPWLPAFRPITTQSYGSLAGISAVLGLLTLAGAALLFFFFRA